MDEAEEEASAPRLIVLSDTHCRALSNLPNELVALLRDADVVIHCGDFDTAPMLAALQGACRRLVAVWGNMDPPAVRAQLPDKTVVTIGRFRIGVIHPSWGGPPWGIEDKIAQAFDGSALDLVCYGHTHSSSSRVIGGTVFYNPGKARAPWMGRATCGVITADDDAGLGIETRSFPS